MDLLPVGAYVLAVTSYEYLWLILAVGLVAIVIIAAVAWGVSRARGAHAA